LPGHIAADLARLPFADDSFDCITCGYVLEHLPDARTGLAELARVMAPGGRMLLLTTEDNFSGAWTSRVWCCRTYNRQELYRTCEELGLELKQELWYTRMHRLLRAGGICVELKKRSSAPRL
jgi:SAM-dependent methyltransferase